jgi:DNA-binding LacI/PurR family transcriptional regulator
MPAKNVRPAVTKAVRFIEQALSADKWSTGQRMPPVGLLAPAAGVSGESMRRALRILSRRGKVTVWRGGKILAGRDRSRAADNAAAPVPQWKNIAIQIKRDSVSERGVFAQKNVSVKQVQAMYGICFRTARKALDALVADRALVRYNKFYQCSRHSAASLNASVAFIAPADKFEHLYLYNPRLRQLITALEAECENRRLALHLFASARFDPQSRRSLLNYVRRCGNCLGCLLWTGEWSNDKHSLREFEQLLLELAAIRRPVAVFDEMGTFSLPRSPSKHGGLRIFSLAGKKAGMQAGRLLLELGHTRLAYISMQHSTAWSNKRLNGLCEAFDSAGYSGAVAPVTASSIINLYELVLMLCDFSAAEFERILHGCGYTPEYIGMLMSDYRAAQEKRGAFPIVKQPRFDRIRSTLNTLPRIFRIPAQAKYLERTRYAFFELAREEVTEAYLEPFFEQALQDPSITAWVGANDWVSLYALNFLRAKSIEVPGRISLLGFDNLPETFFNEITSYDFAVPLIARKMLLHVLAPGKSADSADGPHEEVEGIIIQRASTAHPSPAPPRPAPSA